MPQGTPQSAAFFMTFGKPQSAGDPMPNAFCGFSFLRQMNASERMMRKTAEFVLMAAMPVLLRYWAQTEMLTAASILRNTSGVRFFKSVKNEAAAH